MRSLIYDDDDDTSGKQFNELSEVRIGRDGEEASAQHVWDVLIIEITNFNDVTTQH